MIPTPVYSRRNAIAGPLFLVLLFLFFFSGCKKEEPPPKAEGPRPAKLVTVSSGAEALNRKYPGKVRASNRVELAFQVSGPLVELPVAEGTFVKKGTLVARILPRDYQTALDAARADARASQQQYERTKQLYIRKQVSKAEFDAAKRAFDVSRAQVEKARNALQDTRLTAPFSGMIARKYVDNFQEVTAKQRIVSLQDLSELEILVDVPQVAMARVRNLTIGEEMAHAVFPSAPDKEYPLRLKNFETEADPQTHTYRVILSMPAPEDLNVLPGMTPTVIGKTPMDPDQIQSRIFIPAAAVFADETGNQFVWVVDAAGAVSRRQVKAGPMTGDRIQILSGLSGGEKVVAAGVHQLQPGMQVRPLPRNGEADA